MRTRTIRIDIDTKKLKILKYKQYDHNVLLKIVLYKNNQLIDLSSYTASAFFELPDKTVIQRNLNVENSIIFITLENIILEQDGKAILEVVLSNKNQIVTTFSIYLDIEKSIDRNVAIEGNPQWDIIKDGLISLNDKVDKSELKDIMDEYFEEITLEGVDLTGYVTKKEWNDLIDDNNIKIENLNNNKANNLFSTNMLTSSSLGGISAGTNLNNMSIQDILTKLFYPYVPPSVSASIIYNPIENLYEFGQTIIITQIKAIVTKKSENLTNIKFYQNGLEINEITNSVSDGGTFTYTFSTPIIITSPINADYFQTKVIDSSGKIVSANTTSLNFCYPYYYGLINVEDKITEDLIKGLEKRIEKKGTKSYTYNPNYQRMVIAYPQTYGMLKSILDKNGFEQINSFSCNEISIIGLDKTSQLYYVYVNDASTNIDFKMTFYY